MTITDISANSVSITGGAGDIRLNRLNADDEINISVGSGSIRGSIAGSRSDFTVV